MFIQRLLNEGPTPLMEQAIRFSAARQKLIAENIANVSTPGYVQKDLSLEKFQGLLRERIEQRDHSPAGTTRFDDIMGRTSSPVNNILFHDRSNRSVEQLMADNAKNALFHNMMIELLRKQMSQMEMALKERIA